MSVKLNNCNCLFEEVKNDANTNVKGYVLVSECDECKAKRELQAEENAKSQRRQEIIVELSELDKKVIRPLLDGETERVEAIKTQKIALREELNQL
jgi:hypothetical protein